MSILRVANVHFETTGSNRMDYIAANGEVNIITTGPKLNFSGNLNFTKAGTRITGDFSNATVANRTAFQTSTVNGVTTITVIPNGTAKISQLNLETDSALNNGQVFQMSVIQTSESRFTSNIRGTGTYLPMTFYTGGSERVRIDTSGNVGIGTATAGYKLDVNGTINAASMFVNGAPLQTAINITNETSSASSYYPLLSTATTGSLATANTSSTKLYFTPSTGTLAATVFNSLSDEKYKTDIQTIDNPLEMTAQLRGVWFKWADTGAPSMGLIAQEVEKVLPQIVSENKGIKTLNYDALIGLLIEDIKVLKAEIEKLKNA